MTFFPVPDEFYRDLLYLGWSAEEYALWAIAGSWSADRLTDGLVPTAALALFPPFASSAADALVARGIWKRARGGYQYVTWPRECSRAVVLAKREKEKLKKQRQRAGYAHDQEGNPSSGDVLSPGDNLGDTPEDSPGTAPGSPGPSSNPSNQEKNNQPPSGVGARASARVRAKATRIPDDFAVTHEMVAWAGRETPLVDGRRETAKFIDYWRGKPGRNGTKLDWVATWRNWMRKAQGDAEDRASAAPRNGNNNSVSGSARMDKALSALVDDDPFRDQYAQQPPNTIDGLMIIEGGRTA